MQLEEGFSLFERPVEQHRVVKKDAQDIILRKGRQREEHAAGTPGLISE
jgi:hypothetical protein